MRRQTTVALATLAVGMLTAHGGIAATLSGIVSDDAGQPVAGAFVSAKQQARKMTVSVVSGQDGTYQLDGLFAESYDLRAVKPGFTAVSSEFAVSELGGNQDFALKAAEDIADQTPGNLWLAALPEGDLKARFITGCTICHDGGSKMVRGPRDEDEWLSVIQMMRESVDIYSVIPTFDNEELAAWLTKHKFGEKPASLPIPDPSKDATAGVVVTEYDVGDAASWAHDMTVEPATGAAWVGDYVNDDLIRIEPRTGAQTIYKLPVKGGGMHTLHFDRSGYLWITLQLTDMVARFNPTDGTFRLYGGFQKGSLVHSFAYDEFGLVQTDENGLIWMSEFGTNALVSLDPESGALKEYPLQGDIGHPYGIAMDSKGRIWYTKYADNILGMLDPKTGDVLEKNMPKANSGPHRMDIDLEDRLWIPNSGTGTLAVYDIKKDGFKEYALPDPDTFPYAVRFDGATGTIWIDGNGSNALYRFDPKSETFDSYRIPSQVAYGRMIAFDYGSGAVWTVLSSYPNKHADRDYGVMVRLEGISAPGGRAE
jgi:virginiamycin B lyase